MEKINSIPTNEEIRVMKEAIRNGIEEGIKMAYDYFKKWEKLDINLGDPLSPVMIEYSHEQNIPDDFKLMPAGYSATEQKMYFNMDEKNTNSLISLVIKLSSSKNMERKLKVIAKFISLHEYTHHIQVLRKKFENVTFEILVDLESQADYYAGKILNFNANFGNALSRQDEDDILEFMQLIGSDVDVERIPGVVTNIKSEGGHSMGAIRKQNFFDGYTGVNTRLDFK